MRLSELLSGSRLSLPIAESFGKPKAKSGSYLRLNADSDVPLETLTQPVLVCGRAVGALSLLPPRSVQTVVTSPPYWSLRDYEVADQTGCKMGWVSVSRAWLWLSTR